MTVATARACRGFRFPAEVILWAVRWCLQFPVSYRELERLLADRGVEVDHVSLDGSVALADCGRARARQHGARR